MGLKGGLITHPLHTIGGRQFQIAETAPLPPFCHGKHFGNAISGFIIAPLHIIGLKGGLITHPLPIIGGKFPPFGGIISGG